MKQKELIINFNWREAREFFDAPNDIADIKMVFYSVNPYDLNDVQNWKSPTFELDDSENVDEDDDLIKNVKINNEDTNLRRKLLVMPTELSRDRSNDVEFKDIDRVSRVPLKKAIDIFRK